MAVGGPAAVFVRTHRERLFPTTPILESLDVRWLRDQTLGPNETTVPLSVDFPGMFEHVLAVLPATRRVVVIMGSSPLEKFWRNELGQESERFAGRLEFVWFDGLSLQERPLERSSNFSDHSVNSSFRSSRWTAPVWLSHKRLCSRSCTRRRMFPSLACTTFRWAAGSSAAHWCRPLRWPGGQPKCRGACYEANHLRPSPRSRCP